MARGATYKASGVARPPVGRGEARMRAFAYLTGITVGLIDGVLAIHVWFLGFSPQVGILIASLSIPSLLSASPRVSPRMLAGASQTAWVPYAWPSAPSSSRRPRHSHRCPASSVAARSRPFVSDMFSLASGTGSCGPCCPTPPTSCPCAVTPASCLVPIPSSVSAGERGSPSASCMERAPSYPL